MQTLTTGQPIKFRYSGHTENGARENKAIFEMITASKALSEFLRDNPTEFLRTYRCSSEQVNKFLRATIGNWSQNSHKREFDKWYIQSSSEVKVFLKDLGLKVQQIKEMDGQHYVTETHSLGELPKDLILPVEIRRQIDENSRRIDTDEGVQDFTYGVMSVANNGYKEAKNFKLKDRHFWANFGGLVLTDPNYAYEVIPITSIELLEGLQAEIEAYEPLISKGGLQGAVEARKQFLLQRVHDRIKINSSPEEILKVIGADNRFPAPETGVYVLLPNGIGVRNTGDPFAVKADPRYDEDKIAGIMGVLTNQERRFETLRFQALEVPERALQYITNPKNLKLRLS
ncbi:hypothetical protein J4408_04135 [Candidatus Pacearchaeota archaeon]|nr:hypothetical protein [Candidatus Pacearchaeota archaeon]